MHLVTTLQQYSRLMEKSISYTHVNIETSCGCLCLVLSGLMFPPLCADLYCVLYERVRRRGGDTLQMKRLASNYTEESINPL